MKSALAGVAVLLVAGATLWFLRGPDSRVEALAENSSRASGTRRTPAELATPEALDQRLESAPIAVAETPSVRREAPVSSEASVVVDELLPLRGTLLAVNEYGEVPCATGTLAVVPVFASGRAGARRTVVVENGGWSCRVEPCRELLLRAAVCDGMDAEFLPEGRPVTNFPFPADGFLHLRVAKTPGWSLRVIDADSGADLDGVLLLKPETPTPHRWTFPPRQIVVEHGRSPVAIPIKAQHRLSYWVWAPGHAWTRAAFPDDSTSERVVALEKSGDLQVVIENCPRETRVEFRPRLHIDRRHTRPSVPNSSRGEGHDSITILRPLKDEHLLRDLSPGSYRLQVRTCRTPSDNVLLGQAEVWVESGLTATAIVRLDDIPLAAPRARLRGTLRFHESWGETLRSHGSWADFDENWSLRNPSLLIRPTTQSPLEFSKHEIEARTFPRDKDSLLYDWDVDMKPEGEYTALVTPSQLVRTIATGAANHIEIGPAAQVIVTFESQDPELSAVLRDRASRLQELPPREMSLGARWARIDSDGSIQGTANALAGEAGEVRFAVPVGSTIEVGAMGSTDWSARAKTLTVGPGETHVVLELEPVDAVEVR